MQNSALFQVLPKISGLLKLLSLRLVFTDCSQNWGPIVPGGGWTCDPRHCLPTGSHSWRKARKGHGHHVADQQQNFHQVPCTFATFFLVAHFCVRFYSQISYGKVGGREKGWGGLWHTACNRKPLSWRFDGPCLVACLQSALAQHRCCCSCTGGLRIWHGSEESFFGVASLFPQTVSALDFKRLENRLDETHPFCFSQLSFPLVTKKKLSFCSIAPSRPYGS